MKRIFLLTFLAFTYMSAFAISQSAGDEVTQQFTARGEGPEDDWVEIPSENTTFEIINKDQQAKYLTVINGGEYLGDGTTIFENTVLKGGGKQYSHLISSDINPQERTLIFISDHKIFDDTDVKKYKPMLYSINSPHRTIFLELKNGKLQAQSDRPAQSGASGLGNVRNSDLKRIDPYTVESSAYANNNFYWGFEVQNLSSAGYFSLATKTETGERYIYFEDILLPSGLNKTGTKIPVIRATVFNEIDPLILIFTPQDQLENQIIFQITTTIGYPALVKLEGTTLKPQQGPKTTSGLEILGRPKIEKYNLSKNRWEE